MKTIQQTEEVLYTTPTIQDAIIMLPLMDQIYDSACKQMTLEAYNNLPEEEKKLYRTPWRGEIQNALKIYGILTSIGFRTSHGEKLKANLQQKSVREV